ncbi:MAG: DUF3387 domain-containing protein [Acidobacteria bacterium]|nr:DUF3387 domain-containing protein [Acidobacteriota bacterium]
MVKRIETRSLPTLIHCFPSQLYLLCRLSIHSILREHGYPPDLEEEATKTVLAQAELLCAEWAA